MWIGTAGLLVVAAPAIRAQTWTAVRPATWLAVFYSGAFSIATAYLLWAYCLRQIGSTRTVVYTNATPLVALALAWATLGEVPSPLQVVGAVGIVAGSFLVGLHPRSN
jgi:drug/metabolite transporter (DMT)-like permease